MADNKDDDDIYNDPATIGEENDDVTGMPDNKLTEEEKDDLSQSIYTPEKDTTDLDDRGSIDELEAADDENPSDMGETTDRTLLDDEPTDHDPDSFHLGDVNPADEQDGTERQLAKYIEFIVKNGLD